jgi:transposase
MLNRFCDRIKKKRRGDMARYKHTDVEDGQGLFLSVNLKKQLMPDSFEYMLDELIGGKIDVSGFDINYKNDKTGAAAIPPAALIKLIIYGYSKGANSSRRLFEMARDNIIAKALTGSLEPHWTAIADFISGNSKKFEDIFTKVLAYCVELGLVGGKTFAVDGARLPSNASIDLSGTAKDLEKRLKVYRRMAEKHIEKHRRKDAAGEVDKETERHYGERQKKLNRGIEKISVFLETMEKKEGKRGNEITSNVTDNESAMIHTPSGYIQGYIGIAVSDQKEQIIVSSRAFGSANESGHLSQMLDETLDNIKEAGLEIPEEAKPLILADSNYFSEANLNACGERGVEAIIPDSNYKNRLGNNGQEHYEAEDFTFHEEGDYYECPSGKKLEYKGDIAMWDKKGKKYAASLTDCRSCPHNEKCLRYRKGKTKYAKPRVLFITESSAEGSLCRAMKKKLDTVEYQDKYAYRMQIIEPVFANIVSCKRLNRFTLRGEEKVNGQWQLYSIVHNLNKCRKVYAKLKSSA